METPKLTDDDFDRLMRDDAEFKAWFGLFGKLVFGIAADAARKEVKRDLARANTRRGTGGFSDYV